MQAIGRHCFFCLLYQRLQQYCSIMYCQAAACAAEASSGLALASGAS